jgi:hypothetical protein
MQSMLKADRLAHHSSNTPAGQPQATGQQQAQVSTATHFTRASVPASREGCQARRCNSELPNDYDAVRRAIDAGVDRRPSQKLMASVQRLYE